jgi:hypothetical protein
MVEVLIALFLTMIGVIALLSMQPQGWLLSGRSDYLGRAAEVLHEQLESIEALIMNPCNSVTAGGARNIRVSGMGSAQSGDITFTVTPTITLIGTNVWRVTVRVTWPSNTTGISESIVVTRQEPFRFPAGCVDGSTAIVY